MCLALSESGSRRSQPAMPGPGAQGDAYLNSGNAVRESRLASPGGGRQMHLLIDDAQTVKGRRDQVGTGIFCFSHSEAFQSYPAVFLCRQIAAQLVSHDLARRFGTSGKHPFEKPLGCRLVPTFPQQDIELDAMLID
ncbi:hypothetical protein AWB69_03729 [Caballeronia udeis]|uniref:Uncharacterized protein n=1 Tax=Caballeronia udeis TaxID=1232866 RepID=A0A158H184_9BURK|nr:hypothetical protein AWB69_03729 [Caballeronia udeis]